MVPFCKGRIPAIKLNKVDFPTPLGPRIETISPFCTSSDTLFKTALSPKEKLTSLRLKYQSPTNSFVKPLSLKSFETKPCSFAQA